MKRDFEESTEEDEEHTTSPITDQYQCLVDVLGDVSERNGLGRHWSEHQKQIQLHLDNWKACEKLDSKLFKLMYVL